MVKIHRFNEDSNNTFQQIINIAADEGIFVYDEQEALNLGWGDDFYYFDRYPLKSDGNNYEEPDGDPVMSVAKFVSIIQEVFQRLDAEGMVIHKPFLEIPFRNHCNVFSKFGGIKYKPIMNDDIDTNVDLTYASIKINH